LAAELMIWSIACIAKLKVMNSTIGAQPAHRRADADAGKAMLGDRRIDHALGAELLQQALRDLVGALIFARLPRPSRNTPRRARISSAIASRSASRTVIVLTISVPAGRSGSAATEGQGLAR
jgi:hypothetical protein